MPTPKSLHIDAILSTLSVQYRNAEMLWQEILPIVKVGKRSDKFFIYNKADSFKLVSDRIGAKALPNEADWGVTTDNYSVNDHALGDWLPQETIDNSDAPIRPEIDTNDFLNMLLDTAQEKRVVDLVFSASTYPTGNKTDLATGSNTQWDEASGDPIKDIETAIESCFVRANTLVMGQETWSVLRRHADILDAVKSSTRYQTTVSGGLAGTEEVAQLFGVEKVLIGRSKYVSSKEGQTPVYTRLWGKHCAALHVAKAAGIKTITFGGTFVEMMRQTQKDFDPKRGIKGAHYFKVAWNSDEKIIASDLGYFIENAIS
jgi:hypothetical protein